MNEEEIRRYCLSCKNKPCTNNGCPLENNIQELNFITRQDGEYIEVKCYNTKTKDLLYDRYDTILGTLKFHQGIRDFEEL